MPQCTYTGCLGPRRQTPRDGARKVDNIITTWGQELTPPTIIAGYLHSHGSQLTAEAKLGELEFTVHAGVAAAEAMGGTRLQQSL
jgi:hypothetical protein